MYQDLEDVLFIDNMILLLQIALVLSAYEEKF